MKDDHELAKGELVLPNLSRKIGLEIGAGLDMEPCQPPSPADISIDANSVTEVERLM